MQRIRRFHQGFGYVNKVTLVGNVGNKPEIKQIEGTERTYAQFSLATTESMKKSEGEYEKVTQWHRINVVNTKLAEFSERFLQSGSKVYVEGKLQYREYEKEGVKRRSTEIVVGMDGSLVSLSSATKASGEDASASAAAAPTSGTQSSSNYSRR